jgi:5-methylcytosine-specific restriction endonuclease McrA
MTNVMRKRFKSPSQPTGCWIRREKRLAIYLRDKFHCVYCDADLHAAKPADVTLDHLIPLSVGGAHEANNLVTSCRSCNSARQNRPWQSFARSAAVIVRIKKLLKANLRPFIVLSKDLIAAKSA